MIHQVEGVREHGWRLLDNSFKREEERRRREGREMAWSYPPNSL